MPNASASRKSSRDQRAAVRFDTTLSVRLPGAEGLANNISNTGICFETDTRQEVGSLVNVVVEYRLYGRRQRLSCEGKVVRVEREGDRTRIAARLLAPFFEEEVVAA